MTPLQIVLCAVLIPSIYCSFFDLENAFGKSLIESFEEAARRSRELPPEHKESVVGTPKIHTGSSEIKNNHPEKEAEPTSVEKVKRQSDNDTKVHHKRELTATTAKEKQENSAVAKLTEIKSEDGNSELKKRQADRSSSTVQIAETQSSTEGQKVTETNESKDHSENQSTKRKRETSSPGTLLEINSMQDDNSTHHLHQKRQDNDNSTQQRVARDNFLREYRKRFAERFRRSEGDNANGERECRKVDEAVSGSGPTTTEGVSKDTPLTENAVSISKEAERSRRDLEDATETLVEPAEDATQHKSDVSEASPKQDTSSEKETEGNKERKKRRPQDDSTEQTDAGGDDLLETDDEVIDDDMYADSHKKRTNQKRSGRKWDRWGAWSPCSVSCGVGKVTRWRHCTGTGCAPGEKEAQIKACMAPSCT